MKDFKLLAIRPLKGCHEKYRKILKEDEIYKFFNEFDFQIKNNVVEVIVPKSPLGINLYSLKSKENLDKSVNISAVVGKNGSGKSTLLELLFLSMYVIATKKNILSPNIPELLELIKIAKEKNDKTKLGQLEKQKKNLEFIYNNLKVEIYYKIDENYFCLLIDKNITKLDLLEGNKKIQRKYTIKSILDDQEQFDFSDLFYSISTNYSFYSLNSEILGDWINLLFHKNDGYQTPIVINPFRDKGNIDINKEVYLAKQCLLSNILKPVKNGNDSHHRLTEQQTASSLTFTFNEDKVKYAYKKKDDGKDIEVSFEEITYDAYQKLSKREVLNKVYKIFCNKTLSEREFKKIKFADKVENYIIKKLIQISRTYPDYYGYFNEDKVEKTSGEIGGTKTYITVLPANRFESIETYIGRLKLNESHVTFKLRQAINYLYNDLLHDSTNVKWNKNKETSQEEFKISVTDLSNRIKEKTSKLQDIIYLIPPSLFNIEIHLTINDNKLEKSKSLFSELSSGEQQLIQSVQTIIYHINNVDSVFYDENDSIVINDVAEKKQEPEDNVVSVDGLPKKYYRHVNLILDEIELYFHPDYQKRFITYLLNSLDSLNVPNIKGYNIIFSTHSPFILSDIPISNILKLDNGTSRQYLPNDQSFGANVHDLLANDFFLEDGFMGNWAKSKIEEVIIFFNNENFRKEVDIIKKAIKKIGNNLNEEKNKEKTKLQKKLDWINGEISSEINTLDKDSSLKVIEIIGEPILRNKLYIMYHELFGENDKQRTKKELMDLASKAGLKIEIKE